MAKTNAERLREMRGRHGGEGGGPPRKGAAVGTPGAGDPEIQAMNAAAPLLDLVRTDTGERGAASGSYVRFKNCPVCGHSDCFRYYVETNSWACFGDSNKSGYKGGSYVEYMEAAHGMTKAEAVAALRDATGNGADCGAVAFGWGDAPEAPNGAGGGNEVLRGRGPLLPPPAPVQAKNPPKRAPHLIGGLLRRGHAALFVARAKSYKSWDMVALTVAAALGGEWHGYNVGAATKCIFIDPEIDSRTLDWRFHEVAEAMGADAGEIDRRVLRWSLRGFTKRDGEPPEISDVVHDMKVRIRAREYTPGEFGLIVIDSCSCLLEGDENSSHDVRRFNNRCLELAKVSGASVVCVQHEGLAQTGDRAAINRPRGSSVWGDAFDLVLSLARTYPPSGDTADYLGEGEAGFILEVGGNREFAQSEPQRLIWRFPLFRADEDGTTDGWKLARGQQKGGQKTAEKQQDKSRERAHRCVEALLAHMLHEGIGEEGLPANKAAEVCTDALGAPVKASTLKGYVADSGELAVYQKSTQRWLVVPTATPEWQRQAGLEIADKDG